MVDSDADPKCVADIARDVGRQFPEHVLFHTHNPEETHSKFSQMENGNAKKSTDLQAALNHSHDGKSKGHIGY